MRQNHVTGNNIECDSIFNAQVALIRQDVNAPFGGVYFFPDLPQLTGVEIVSLEVLAGARDLPVIGPPFQANIGPWTAFFNTAYLTLYEDTEGSTKPELFRQCPLVQFWLDDGNRRKKITPVNARIHWRSSFLNLVGFSPAPIPPNKVFLNLAVYYNFK